MRLGLCEACLQPVYVVIEQRADEQSLPAALIDHPTQ
jgi:hypothetical protein